MAKIDSDLGELFRCNLKTIREYRDLSQSELGRRTKKLPGYICDLERGRRSPNLMTLAELANGLGVSASVLISEKLPKSIQKSV